MGISEVQHRQYQSLPLDTILSHLHPLPVTQSVSLRSVLLNTRWEPRSTHRACYVYIEHEILQTKYVNQTSVTCVRRRGGVVTAVARMPEWQAVWFRRGGSPVCALCCW
jgi:hypothetical protein